MQITKDTGCLMLILLAAVLAYCLGRKAGNNKPVGRLWILVFGLYGFVPLFIYAFILDKMTKNGIWIDSGDADTGLLLFPLLASPVYWLVAFVGGSISRFDKIK